jgi:hypothetical protein
MNPQAALKIAYLLLNTLKMCEAELKKDGVTPAEIMIGICANNLKACMDAMAPKVNE